MSSKISQEILKESEIVLAPLTDCNLITEMRNWKNLLLSSFGPKGKMAVMQNTLGGSVTFTNSSNCLLDNVQPSHYVLKIVSSVVKNHCNVWYDCGLLAMVLTLQMIEASISSDLPTSKIAIILEHIGDLIVKHLSSDCSICKVKIDVTKLAHLTCVVETILKSKLFSYLLPKEIHYLATVCLQGFLASLSNDSNLFRRINFISCDGYSVLDSKFYKGYLYKLSEEIDETSYELSDLKTAAFDISLAADYESEILQGEHELNEAISFEDIILERILKTIDRLNTLNVSFLACQKVIHPRIKKVLRKKNILFIERLGRDGFDEFLKISNGIAISSFFEDIGNDFFGIVKEVRKIKIHGKSYLQIMNDSQGGTIVLCHRNEELLQQLKIVCKQAVDSLKLLVTRPEAFVGAGCLEAHLMITIEQMILEQRNENVIGVSHVHLQKVFCLLATCLKTIIKQLHPLESDLCIDANSGHLFLSPGSHRCCCGLLDPNDIDLVSLLLVPTLQTRSLDRKKCSLSNELICKMNVGTSSTGEDSVVDVGVCKLSAWKNVFEILGMVLRLELCIIDKN